MKWDFDCYCYVSIGRFHSFMSSSCIVVKQTNKQKLEKCWYTIFQIYGKYVYLELIINIIVIFVILMLVL